MLRAHPSANRRAWSATAQINYIRYNLYSWLGTGPEGFAAQFGALFLRSPPPPQSCMPAWADCYGGTVAHVIESLKRCYRYSDLKRCYRYADLKRCYLCIKIFQPLPKLYPQPNSGSSIPITPVKSRPRVTVLPLKPMEPTSPTTTSSPDAQKRRRSVISAVDGLHHVEIVIATPVGHRTDKSDSRKGCNNAPSPCAVDRSGGGSRRTPIGNEMPKQRNPRRKNGGSPRPPVKNLIHDAVRESNHGGQRRSSGYDDAPGSSQAQADFKFGDNQVGGALLARLSELGAPAPWFVDAKRLQSTDVRADQNRLQLPGTSPLSRAFTDSEIARARTLDGVPVAVLDRRGHEYEMTCKLWKGDKHFRFMGEGWKNFRDAHHLSIAKEARLTRRVTVELWAFRSRALPPMPPPKGKDGGDDEEPRRHPDGALGLVVLVRDDVEEQGEVARQEVLAPPPAESYVSRFLLIMAAVALLTLRTRDGTKRKRDD